MDFLDILREKAFLGREFLTGSGSSLNKPVAESSCPDKR